MKSPWLLGVLVLTVATVSCSHPDVETPMSGSWALAAVNGVKLPIALPPDPDPKSIREGLLLVHADGTLHLRPLGSGKPRCAIQDQGASAGGTWTRDDDDIYLTDKATGKANFGTAYGTALRIVFGKEIHDFVLLTKDPTLWL